MSSISNKIERLINLTGNHYLEQYYQQGFYMHAFTSLTFVRHLILVFALCSLSACGFHLKHNNGLVEKFPEIYLKTNDPKGYLAQQVRQKLRGANIKLLSAPSANAAVLHLKEEQRTERTISLYANAQNAEKEIGYNLAYSIKLPRYTEKEYNFNIYRDFLDDSSQALAKSREAELLTDELRDIAAEHIINTMLTMNNKN